MRLLHWLFGLAIERLILPMRFVDWTVLDSDHHMRDLLGPRRLPQHPAFLPLRFLFGAIATGIRVIGTLPTHAAQLFFLLILLIVAALAFALCAS